MQDVARSAHLLGELVGLALRSVTVCPVELNLRPANVVLRQDLEKRRDILYRSGRVHPARVAGLVRLLHARGAGRTANGADN